MIGMVKLRGSPCILSHLISRRLKKDTEGVRRGPSTAARLRWSRATESEIQFNANLPTGNTLTANRRTRSRIRLVA